MSPAGRFWRKPGRRRDGGAGVDSGDARAAVRQAIVRTREQQARVSAGAGSMFVKRAEIERALEEQRLMLLDAADQIRQARSVAQRAADAARADEAVDSSPYELTAAGLQTQLDVVEKAIGQVGTMRADAERNVARAQAVLGSNAGALDGALRAEVQLLGRLERLERERVIAEARVRSRQRPPPPGGPALPG